MKKIPLWVKLLVTAFITGIVVLATAQLAEKPEIVLAGELKIESGLEDYASANKTLFIIIYSDDPAKPMPLGVMKEPVNVTEAGLIRRFSVTPSKIRTMMSKDPIPDTFRIKARLDRDGMGGKDQPGDITANVTGIKYGSENVVINFDTKI